MVNVTSHPSKHYIDSFKMSHDHSCNLVRTNIDKE
jgi:hypothetical protein